MCSELKDTGLFVHVETGCVRLGTGAVCSMLNNRSLEQNISHYISRMVNNELEFTFGSPVDPDVKIR